MGKLNFEYEVKFRLSDLKNMEKHLKKLGAVYIKEEIECDTYYNHPCKDFKKNDEVLRVRLSGKEITLTYKGPRFSDKIKARNEYNIKISSSKEDLLDFLSILGFKPAAKIQKKRRFFRYEEFEILLDEVKELGNFIEIEIKGVRDLKSAEEMLLEFAKKLGLNEKPILKSYLELFSEKVLSRRPLKNTCSK